MDFQDPTPDFQHQNSPKLQIFWGFNYISSSFIYLAYCGRITPGHNCLLDIESHDILSFPTNIKNINLQLQQYDSSSKSHAPTS